jgi:ribosomal protein S18 acetylase RimI-like enzyme
MSRRPVSVRCTTPADFPGIVDLCKRVYPSSTPWSEGALASHLEVFPEGQFVAIQEGTNKIVGMAASLIIDWDDYDIHASWQDFTARGRFTNHDPEHGRTLYGAEVMVDPKIQGSGVGTKLYVARRKLVESLGLLRIRAGARLRGYGQHADAMTAEEYVIKVIRGELVGPTLSFQLHRGFRVIAVVSGYLKDDPDSLGYAAIIEWLNPKVARREHYAGQPERYRKPREPRR